MRGEFVMSDSSIDKPSPKAMPMKASGSAQPTKRAASAEERRNTRIAALDGQQAELKRQAQERREERGMKTV
jgi:hypothetical protein